MRIVRGEEEAGAARQLGELGEDVDEALLVDGRIRCQHGGDTARFEPECTLAVVDDDHGRAGVAQRARRGEAVGEAHVEHDTERLVGALGEHAADALGGGGVDHRRRVPGATRRRGR